MRREFEQKQKSRFQNGRRNILERKNPDRHFFLPSAFAQRLFFFHLRLFTWAILLCAGYCVMCVCYFFSLFHRNSRPSKSNEQSDMYMKINSKHTVVNDYTTIIYIYMCVYLFVCIWVMFDVFVWFFFFLFMNPIFMIDF